MGGGGSGGMPPPEIFFFLNKYALRCNLVHFERQSCHIVSSDREHFMCIDLVSFGCHFFVHIVTSIL